MDNAVSSSKPKGAILVDGYQVADTVQCVHCSAHWVPVKGSGKTRGWCFNCHGPICGPNCCECVPFEKKLDLFEKGKIRSLQLNFDLFQYQGLAEPVYVEVVVVAPDLVLAICEMPVRRAETRDPGFFSIDFIEANPPAPVVVPEFIQSIGVDSFPGYHSLAYLTAGVVMPPVEQTFPTSLDDLLDILRGLAAELQPNAQYDWEKRRNWQKLVEAFSRI